MATGIVATEVVTESDFRGYFAEVNANGEVELSDAEPYRPEAGDGLRQVFVHLWSRLNEAQFLAEMLAKLDPDSDAYRRNLAALVHVANVQAAYGHMQRLIARAEQKEAA
jgi:hypothetical protein